MEERPAIGEGRKCSFIGRKRQIGISAFSFGQNISKEQRFLGYLGCEKRGMGDYYADNKWKNFNDGGRCL